jgi:hypothetical protein
VCEKKLASTSHRAALEYNVPYTTTLSTAKATLHAIRTLKEGKLRGEEFAGVS